MPLLILANTFKSSGGKLLRQIQNRPDDPDRERLAPAAISDLVSKLWGVELTSGALIWQQLLIRQRSFKSRDANKAGCNMNPLLRSAPIKECENRQCSWRRYATMATEQVTGRTSRSPEPHRQVLPQEVRPRSEREDGAPSTGGPAVCPDSSCVNKAPRARHPAHLESSVGFQTSDRTLDRQSRTNRWM